MAKKKPSQQRREVLAKIEADRQRAERRRNSLIAGGAVAVVIGIVVATIIGLRDMNADKQKPATSANGDIAGVQTYEVKSRDHVDGDVDYPQSPPVGGDHNPVWLNCGTYTAAVPVTSAVHSMEHGAVWLTYQPDLDPGEVAKLDDLAASSDYLLVTPYSDQQSPIVASAWGVQLELDSASDPRLQQFLTAYLQGPQTPEPGAACTGGTMG